jgi:hypothetical protein
MNSALPAQRRSRYYVVITQRGEIANTWRWEIRRKWKPIGVKYSEGGLSSRGKSSWQACPGGSVEPIDSGCLKFQKLVFALGLWMVPSSGRDGAVPYIPEALREAGARRLPAEREVF